MALQIDSNNGIAWTKLGALLPSSTVVEIGGRSYDKTQCFITALDVMPENADAWYHLALTFPIGGEERDDVGGEGMSRQQCLINALETNPSHQLAWQKLGLTIAKDATVTVGETAYTHQECMVNGGGQTESVGKKDSGCAMC
eukprot:TRINITY_DN16316_c0_g2_i1.p1 TRINITY_DN16316_c0_g2~~TRINITY_DN16316_c0_g2_i1.p1  ORF type:complete len:142 (+),score=25.73 TRINITY_DN16316_c0_g2_i1:172-597(+)